MTDKMVISIIANSQISYKSMGGSDKIFIELARAWKKSGVRVLIYGCREAGAMCRNAGLQDEFRVFSKFDVEKFGLFAAYFLRTACGIFRGRLIKEGVLYSSSDFYPDLIFAFWQKMINANLKWAAGIFLIAPHPLKNSSARTFRGVIYWFTQKIAIMLMRLRSDCVIVLSEEDKAALVKYGIHREKVVVISPGIDLEGIAGVPETAEKHYSACFVGRFHQQKGIPELLHIWKIVTAKFPDAKLALVGWGSQSWIKLINSTVQKLGLENNVCILGFLDNSEKYRVLKSSSLFVFPSSYESWGIVVAEAMGCGCPVVAFDISATRKFKKGVVLTDLTDTGKFADAVTRLLGDKAGLFALAQQAREAAAEFSWQRTADTLVNALRRSDA